MKNLLNKILIKRRHLIVEEKDVLTALKVVNQNRDFAWLKDMAVGTYESEGQPTRWFVHFFASEEKWLRIRKELQVIRVWDREDIPETGGEIYSTD